MKWISVEAIVKIFKNLFRSIRSNNICPGDIVYTLDDSSTGYNYFTIKEVFNKSSICVCKEITTDLNKNNILRAINSNKLIKVNRRAYEGKN